MEDQSTPTLMNSLRLIVFLCLSSLQTVNATETDSQWYHCIVNASSHRDFYTFRINQQRCEIYWKEIDTQINVTECKLPIMAALKSSAQDKYSVVWFNLETGAFYDYLSGVKDRVICTTSKIEPKPYSSNR